MFVFLEQKANTGRVLDVAITIYLTVTRKEKRKTNFLLPLAFSEMVLVSWGLGSPHICADTLVDFRS